MTQLIILLALVALAGWALRRQEPVWVRLNTGLEPYLQAVRLAELLVGQDPGVGAPILEAAHVCLDRAIRERRLQHGLAVLGPTDGAIRARFRCTCLAENAGFLSRAARAA